MSAPTSPPDLPPPPPPSGQWAFPTDEKGEPKKNYVLWVVFGAAGCFVAIVALGLVATLVIPNLVRRIQHDKAQRDIELLCAALQVYTSTHGERYPDTLEALLRPDPQGHKLRLELHELPRDPWGRAYHYDPPPVGQSWPDVYSLGRDGLAGGSGADEDIHPLRAAQEKR